MKYFKKRSRLLIPIAGGALFSLLVDSMISEKVQLGEPEAAVAMSLIELVALMLPALAILLQVTVKYSRSSAAAIIGQGIEIRRLAYLMVGFSSILLMVAVFISLRYLDLPLPLTIASYLVTFSILSFIMLPLAIAYFGWNPAMADAERFIDSAHGMKVLSDFEDYPEDVQETVYEIVGKNSEVIEEMGPSDDEVTEEEESKSESETEEAKK